MINDGELGPDLANFEYTLDTSQDDHMVNWYVTMDLMCLNPMDYLSMVSWFFIGFGVGIVFFIAPDIFGRRDVMLPLLMVNIWIMYVGTFQKNLELLKIASFLHGFFHIKITICYTQAVEFVPDKYRSVVITLINIFVSSEYIVLGLFYQFIEPNTDKLMTFYFLIGTLACVLYFAFIPESPFWLINNEGPNSQKAIANLNSIAILNGSTYQIPCDTLITLSEHDELLDRPPVNKQNKNGLSHIIKDFSLLIFDREKRNTHLKMTILFIIANFYCMLCMFNS